MEIMFELDADFIEAQRKIRKEIEERWEKCLETFDDKNKITESVEDLYDGIARNN